MTGAASSGSASESPPPAAASVTGSPRGGGVSGADEDYDYARIRVRIERVTDDWMFRYQATLVDVDEVDDPEAWGYPLRFTVTRWGARAVGRRFLKKLRSGDLTEPPALPEPEPADIVEVLA